MLKQSGRKHLWGLGVLCLVPLTILPEQENAKVPKKPELIELQLKVVDKTDGSPIDNADVHVMWGQDPPPGYTDGISNAKGIARLKNVPRSTVVIRVIANGYKNAAPSVDLNKKEQPVKIEMEKNPSLEGDFVGSARKHPQNTRPASAHSAP